MHKRQLGNTDLWLSEIGLGTVKIGRNEAVKYPNAFDLPDDNQVLNLLSTAQELGINTLDTAPAYGLSEKRLGKLMSKNRHNWVIISKAGEDFANGQSSFNFTPKHITMSVERSLNRLATDYIDILLIHSNGEDKQIVEQFNVFETLSALKTAGKIRAFGMSSKTISGGLLSLQHADCAMITYNHSEQTEKSVIDYAETHTKGILVKKAFCSGHFKAISTENKIQHATEFVLNEPGITSMITGTINPEHLKETASHTHHV